MVTRVCSDSRNLRTGAFHGATPGIRLRVARVKKERPVAIEDRKDRVQNIAHHPVEIVRHEDYLVDPVRVFEKPEQGKPFLLVLYSGCDVPDQHKAVLLAVVLEIIRAHLDRKDPAVHGPQAPLRRQESFFPKFPQKGWPAIHRKVRVDVRQTEAGQSVPIVSREAACLVVREEESRILIDKKGGFMHGAQRQDQATDFPVRRNFFCFIFYCRHLERLFAFPLIFLPIMYFIVIQKEINGEGSMDPFIGEPDAIRGKRRFCPRFKKNQIFLPCLPIPYECGARRQRTASRNQQECYCKS